MARRAAGILFKSFWSPDKLLIENLSAVKELVYTVKLTASKPYAFLIFFYPFLAFAINIVIFAQHYFRESSQSANHPPPPPSPTIHRVARHQSSLSWTWPIPMIVTEKHFPALTLVDQIVRRRALDKTRLMMVPAWLIMVIVIAMIEVIIKFMTVEII